MDLNIAAQIVGIVGGIVAILRGIQELLKGSTTSTIKLPQFIDIGTKFLIATGIVILLYSGVLFVSANAKVNSLREACLDGKDTNSYSVVQTCNQFTATQFNKNIKPSLVTIGFSFIMIAIALFVRNFSTASVFLFTLEIVWFALGSWLVFRNL